MINTIRQLLVNRKLRDYATGYAFVIPALAVYVFFVVYPFFYTIYLSLTKWDGAKPVKEFVGLLNYEQLFADSRLWSALSHNLIWIVLGTITPVAIGLFLGVLLWRGSARHGLLPHRLLPAGGAGAGGGRHHLEVDV